MNLSTTFLRLRPDSRVDTLPVDQTFWQRLMSGALGNFHHEYLVTVASYTEDWPSWERHPNGDEIVCLLSGKVEFVLETRDGNTVVELAACGDFVKVPQGTWHTARVGAPSQMLFITAGEGTENRPANG